HPHVHLIIPGGAIDAAAHRWRTPKGKFLFSHKALATVFRARMLEGMKQAKLLPQSTLPETWVVDCRAVGNGLPALKYLARYLYRGVISESQLLCDDGEMVTFRYLDAQTQQWKTRTVDGAHFLWLLIQHVLPRGFRRVRDYGFLHGNSRRKLLLVQWVLKVSLAAIAPPRPRPELHCPHCTIPMRFTGISLPKRLSG
uniref:IS91 family transposase n=1 Tax=Granulosicoccus sp. 3-233 TaxID=3417969 RepID=UPI003D34E5D3